MLLDVAIGMFGICGWVWALNLKWWSEFSAQMYTEDAEFWRRLYVLERDGKQPPQLRVIRGGKAR